MSKATPPTPYDAVVIGAGAAGMMCAATAAAHGAHVALVDHAAKIGRKIRISGGGRCNFTNIHAAPENYLSENPSFCKSALARYTPADFIALVESHHIPYHEKKLGQLFCDRSADDIVHMLVAECRRHRVNLLHPQRVLHCEKLRHFRVRTDQATLHAHNLVVACGGLSLPKTGASNLGYRIAEQFGHRLTPLKPGLVGIQWNDRERQRYKPLAGISVDSRVRCGSASFRENLLFTHRGLSGPAILQASSYWEPQHPMTIDLLPDQDPSDVLASRRSHSPRDTLRHLLPSRLADAWTSDGFSNTNAANLPREKTALLTQSLKHWQVVPQDTEGYGKAEVTRGGVDTANLHSKTMESAIVPGLHFVGEVVDVTGWLGGYNFQWAWASGHAAGVALGR